MKITHIQHFKLTDFDFKRFRMWRTPNLTVRLAIRWRLLEGQTPIEIANDLPSANDALIKREIKLLGLTPPSNRKKVSNFFEKSVDTFRVVE